MLMPTLSSASLNEWKMEVANILRASLGNEWAQPTALNMPSASQSVRLHQIADFSHLSECGGGV